MMPRGAILSALCAPDRCSFSSGAGLLGPVRIGFKFRGIFGGKRKYFIMSHFFFRVEFFFFFFRDTFPGWENLQTAVREAGVSRHNGGPIEGRP